MQRLKIRTTSLQRMMKDLDHLPKARDHKLHFVNINHCYTQVIRYYYAHASRQTAQ